MFQCCHEITAVFQVDCRIGGRDLFDELLLYIILLVGLEEGKQSLLFTDRAAAQHHRQTLQQGSLTVKGLVQLVL